MIIGAGKLGLSWFCAWDFVWYISAVTGKTLKWYFGKIRVKEAKGSVNVTSEWINISPRSLIIGSHSYILGY